VTSFGTIEKLRRDHSLDGFDCGREELNSFLKKHALTNQASDSARTYVLADRLVVKGYYSLAAAIVFHEEATERVKKGLARHPVPVILLARLAVDASMQGKKIAPALLKDALRRAVHAADTIGTRAVLVHAKDDNAKGFYEHFSFEPSPSDPYHLMLIMKDLRRIIAVGDVV
jgi:GNAT superfamily N-acetyltransferase